MKNRWDYDLKLNYQGNYIKCKIFGFDPWWLPIMEGSYRQNDVQIEYNMFCNSNNTWYNVSRNFKNGLFFIHPFNYGILLGGNQPYTDKNFKIQKKVIRIITSSRMRDSRRELFKKLEILPLYSQYQYLL